MSTDVYSKQLNIKELEDSDYFVTKLECLESSVTIEDDSSIFSEKKNENNEQLKKSLKIETNLFNMNVNSEKTSSNDENTELLNQVKEIEKQKKVRSKKENIRLSVPNDYNKTQEDPQTFVKEEVFKQLGPSDPHIVIQNSKQNCINPQIPKKSNDHENSFDNPKPCNISKDSISQVAKNEKYIPEFPSYNSEFKKEMKNITNKEILKYHLSDLHFLNRQKNLTGFQNSENHSVESRCSEFAKNKKKRLEIERQKLHIKNFSECTFTPNITKQEKENAFLYLYTLKHNENFKSDNNSNSKINKCSNIHLNISKSKQNHYDESRALERPNKMSSMKNLEVVRKRCFSANQMILNENKFTPQISGKSKLMLRLEGIENILYNDAKRRQLKKIEIELCNNSPKITNITKHDKYKNCKENVFKKFTLHFNNALQELNIYSDQLDKSQLKMILKRFEIIYYSKASEKLFDKAWGLLNDKSNKVSNSNILRFFGKIFGTKPIKPSEEDIHSGNNNDFSSNEYLGKLNDKGEYITTHYEEIKVKIYFKLFYENYLRTISRSMKKQRNSVFSNKDSGRSKCTKGLNSSSLKLFETSKQMKEKIINNSIKNPLNSTLKEFKTINEISKKEFNQAWTEHLVNSNRKVSIKIHQMKKNIHQIEAEKCTFCPQIISKIEDKNQNLSKYISPKSNKITKLVDEKMKVLVKYRKDCPFKPLINNYTKLTYSPSLPKNALFQIERIRKAY